MYLHLDQTIGTKENNTNYFFTLLGPRFDVMVDSMAKSLEKKFGQHYKPIYVYSAHPNSHFVKDNFIVLNEEAEKIENSVKSPVVYLREYEELNVEFAESKAIRSIANTLLAKQETIYVFPFNTAFLELAKPKWTVIGPAESLAKYYDNKLNQYEIFTELDLPRARARAFSNKQDLYGALPSILPSFISAAYTSGGAEKGLISSKEDLDKFISELRNINANGPFLVADIFDDITLSPNVNAIITGLNETNVLAISDQILRGQTYLGNIYPSAMHPQQEKLILDSMSKLGNHLSQQGYRGLFGCDFLINNKGDMIIVDLNPRRQGGYACNALALKTVGVELTDLELDCALLGQVPHVQLNYENLRCRKAWAHTKIKPFERDQHICKTVRINDMYSLFQSEQASSYIAMFYKMNSFFVDGYVGYVVSTGNDRQTVFDHVQNLSNFFLDSGLKKPNPTQLTRVKQIIDHNKGALG